MAKFDVWAPGHENVDLLLDNGARRLPMEKGERGWRSLEVAGVGPGTRYQFSIEGGPPRPDPRSPWQPDGPDGPSAVVDHRAFNWSDQAWRGTPLSQAVIYEAHLGTFSAEGTFDGVIAHLAHLVNLGVNAIELLPVAEAGGQRGWGYDGVDLWAPHHAYGGPDGLRRLVDACHRQKIAVVLDVVYNHLGPAGNYLSEFGPYFTDQYRTPWGSAVNVDGPGSYGVRDFVISNALMWLRDYHVDGLRLDAVHAIFDESALHIMEELSTAVDDLASQMGRQLWLIAECDRNDPRLTRRREQHGYGISAAWDDDFHHALHTVLTGEKGGYYADFGSIGQLAKVFTDAYVYDGAFSELRQRAHGRPAPDLPGWSFVVALQNHDQVGNRAFGERTSHLLGPDELKVGAALLLLSPFVPLLFQGEEWGASTFFQYFTDHQDPDLGRAVTEGRRKEHAGQPGEPGQAPDPQELETFARSKLDWSELAREPHRSLFEWHRQLIALRTREPELGSDDRKSVGTNFDEQARWLVVRRGHFSIATNLASTAQPVPLEGAGQVVLASADGAQVAGEDGNGGAAIALPPRSVAVIAH